MKDRPTVKIRLDAVGRGTISIDDGPPLPVRKLKLESGVSQATIVSMELIAVNVDADLPVDQFDTRCRRCGATVLGKLSQKHPCVRFKGGSRKGERRMMLPLVP